MTTANIIPNPNLGFIKYWGMVTENVAVDNLLNFVEFKNRSTNRVEEIVAVVAHACIPDLGVGFPGITGKLVRSIRHK